MDWFASFYNAELPRFFSKFWNPGSEAADAFTVSWLGECCWLDPPLHLIVWVLKHVKACSAVGTLIIPAWKSSPFWPFVCPDGQYLANFVHAWDTITFNEGLISVGLSGNNFSSAFYSDPIILVLHANSAGLLETVEEDFVLRNTWLVVVVCARYHGWRTRIIPDISLSAMYCISILCNVLDVNV